MRGKVGGVRNREEKGKVGGRGEKEGKVGGGDGKGKREGDER